MSIADHELAAASKAAQESLEFICLAETFAAEGNRQDAMRVLNAIRTLEEKYATTLENRKDDFARIADDIVPVPSSRSTLHYTSYHDAMRAVWLTIDLQCSHNLVPDDLRGWLGIDTSLFRSGLERERAKVLAPVPPKQPRRKNPKGGRTPKDEKPVGHWVLEGLCDHHKYDNGSVLNYEPATNMKFGERYKLANNALKRYLDGRFKGRNGTREYKVHCDNETIGGLLLFWKGEMPSHQPGLTDEESGRRDDH